MKAIDRSPRSRLVTAVPIPFGAVTGKVSVPFHQLAASVVLPCSLASLRAGKRLPDGETP